MSADPAVRAVAGSVTFQTELQSLEDDTFGPEDTYGLNPGFRPFDEHVEAIARAAVEAARPIQVAPLIRQIEHMANISHRAHHRSAGKGAATVGWRECSLPFCADAHTVVRAAVRTEPSGGMVTTEEVATGDYRPEARAAVRTEPEQEDGTGPGWTADGNGAGAVKWRLGRGRASGGVIQGKRGGKEKDQTCGLLAAGLVCVGEARHIGPHLFAEVGADRSVRLVSDFAPRAHVRTEPENPADVPWGRIAQEGDE